jgi:cysteine-rich repeat protein
MHRATIEATGRVATWAAVSIAALLSLTACRLDLSFEIRDGRGDPDVEGADGIDAEWGPDDAGPDDGAAESDAAELVTCGNASVEPGEECDDGNDIPGDGCEPGSCRYSCHNDAECADGNVCNGDETCDTAETHACRPGTNAPAGTPCEDGAACTRDDQCDGGGRCAGVKDDTLCPGGEVCTPHCFEGPGGCGVPPSSLVMSCESPVDPASASACTISLDSIPGQAGCIHCDARFGMVVLDFSDFGDGAGACDMGGWTLASGPVCRDDYNAATCDETGSTIECCSDPATICVTRDGRYALRSGRGFNCGGGYEEWRISKTFDTTGLGSLELDIRLACFASTLEDFIIVKASDAAHSENLACATGRSIMRTVALRGPGSYYLYTFGLPPWAEDNGDVTITVTANSNAPLELFFVDYVSLRGWPRECLKVYQTVFTEDFTGCPDPIPDGWNGWEVTGAPRCPGFDCPGGEGDSSGAEAAGGAWMMQRTVDTSSLDADVRLCFDLGDNGANTGELIAVQFSTDGGSTWRSAWYQEQEMTLDGFCAHPCVSLSALDPDAARNPDMKIRFTLRSDGQAVTVDDITVSGAVFYSAGGTLAIDPVTETGVPGIYGVVVHDAAGEQMTAQPSCSWDDPAVPVSGWDEISFVISH